VENILFSLKGNSV